MPEKRLLRTNRCWQISFVPFYRFENNFDSHQCTEIVRVFNSWFFSRPALLSLLADLSSIWNYTAISSTQRAFNTPLPFIQASFFPIVHLCIIWSFQRNFIIEQGNYNKKLHKFERKKNRWFFHIRSTVRNSIARFSFPVLKPLTIKRKSSSSSSSLLVS